MVDPFDASAAFVAETIGLLREHKPGLASAVRSLCSDVESGSSRPMLAASIGRSAMYDRTPSALPRRMRCEPPCTAIAKAEARIKASRSSLGTLRMSSDATRGSR